VEVIGVQFSGPGEPGDFTWMLEQDAYRDALFVFNDNEEQFLAFLASRKDPADAHARAYGCQDGGGNAAIRHYRCADPPRAAGVPTGRITKGGGYPELTPDVTAVLEQAFTEIRRVLASGRYERVFYSAANAQGDLGHGIFDPGDDVKRHIVSELRKLAG
jgi:hypothetical protein